MYELHFLAFCITVIALTAIALGKDKVAEKALSALSHIMEDFITVFERKLVNFKQNKLSNKDERAHKSANDT